MDDPRVTVDLALLLSPIESSSIGPEHREQICAVLREAHRVCGGDRDLMLRAFLGSISVVAGSVGVTHHPDGADRVFGHCIGILERSRLTLASYVGSVVAAPQGEPS